MCTREELNILIRELLHHVEQVAIWSAKIQFNEENKSFKSMEYLTCCDKTNNDMRNILANKRFKQIARFHSAYLKYFIFALDPYADIIIPLSSSSLALFITNMVSKMMPQQESNTIHHTSKTIIEFLQIVNADLVQSLYVQYKFNLMEIIKEMNLPYDLEVLSKIRHECFRKNIGKQRRTSKTTKETFKSKKTTVTETITSQKAQSIQMSRSTEGRQSVNVPMQFQSIEHTIINEEHVMQMPNANETAFSSKSEMQISSPLSPISSDTPIENAYHIQNGQRIGIDHSMPFYLITSTEPITVEISSDENILIENDDQKMTMDMAKNETITSVTGAANQSNQQISTHQLCAGCGKPIQDRYLLKALDMLWHEDCLKCGCCDCRLGEVGSTLYTKANLMLCKRDYLRLFGNTGLCAACNKVIPAFEMVMRARNNVYHLECFACQQCNHRFCVGDRFYLCENKILCEYDYEERLVFASIGNHPMLKRHANNVAQNPPPYSKSVNINATSGGATSVNNANNSGGGGMHSIMAMEQAQAAAVAAHHQQQQQQMSKLQHDDHNNNNNSHGPTTGSSCGMSASPFNSSLLKIPHST